MTNFQFNGRDSIVLDIRACDVTSISREGSSLLVTLEDGRQIMVDHYFDFPKLAPEIYFNNEPAGQELLLAQLER